MSNRPETGPMQFEGDWAGLFIRGDCSLSYALMLRGVLDAIKDGQSPSATDLAVCEELFRVLKSVAEVRGEQADDVQQLESFNDTLKK